MRRFFVNEVCNSIEQKNEDSDSKIHLIKDLFQVQRESDIVNDICQKRIDKFDRICNILMDLSKRLSI